MFKPYYRLSRTATYGFLAALPLLLAYEILILFAQPAAQAQIRVGADVWIKQLLALLGASGRMVLALVIVVVGLAIVFYERRRSIRIVPRYFGWMILESMLYAVVFAIIISNFVAFLFLAAPDLASLFLIAAPLSSQGFWMHIALSLGAGFYEELVFRVILVSGLFWILGHIAKRTDHAYIAAAIIAALIFSAVHYIGPFGDPFALPSFTFRFLFGLALNALYVFRGFGVAAWTHALYDVMLVVFFLR